ncbi:hypothetical protein SODG_001232 [Sodalis praecaptivus]
MSTCAFSASRLNNGARILPPTLHRRKGLSISFASASSCNVPVAVRLIDGSKLARAADSEASAAMSWRSAWTISGRRRISSDGSTEGSGSGVIWCRSAPRAMLPGLLPTRMRSAFSCSVI